MHAFFGPRRFCAKFGVQRINHFPHPFPHFLGDAPATAAEPASPKGPMARNWCFQTTSCVSPKGWSFHPNFEFPSSHHFRAFLSKLSFYQVFWSHRGGWSEIQHHFLGVQRLSELLDVEIPIHLPFEVSRRLVIEPPQWVLQQVLLLFSGKNAGLLLLGEARPKESCFHWFLVNVSVFFVIKTQLWQLLRGKPRGKEVYQKNKQVDTIFSSKWQICAESRKRIPV